MCCYDETPDFEIRINGHKIVQCADGAVRVDGKNFHTDLKDLSSIISVLQQILGSAEEAKKPRLITIDPIIVRRGDMLPRKTAANTR